MRSLRSIGVMTAVLVCSLVVASTGLSAQGQQPPPPGGGRQGGAAPTNLKVLPKDIARPALTTLMRGYTAALGVQCNHCHVEDMAARASDDNAKKDIARKMIQMTMDLNKQLDAMGTPAAADAPKVTCFTCHRGAIKPLTAAGGH